MKWNNFSKKCYSHKYEYTFEKDVFEVDLEDLLPTSGANVVIICDICNNEYKKRYNNYVRHKPKQPRSEIEDVCDECQKYFRQHKDECFKLIIDGKLHSAPKGCSGSFSDEEIINILTHLGEILIRQGVIDSIDELKTKLNKKILIQYKLSALMEKKTIPDLIVTLLPGTQVWETKKTPDDFWEKEENMNSARNWLINKLYQDNIITAPEDLINIDHTKICKQYGLTTLLFTKFKGSRYQFSNFLFPNLFTELDFPLQNNYFNDENNIIKAIDRIIELWMRDGKINSIEDIPTYATCNSFADYGFYHLLVNVFNCHPYECFNFRFPDKWSPIDFKKSVANDGTVTDSKEESQIHNWMIKNLSNMFSIEYNGSNKQGYRKWVNEEYNEYYIPDWIINDNTIVEYFGYYSTSKNTHYRFKKYREKTMRKISYFTDLEGYNFIAIFPKDLKHNFRGLKSKFANYLIHRNEVG